MFDYIKITIRMVQRELDAIGLGGSHFLSSFFLVFLVLTFCSLVMGVYFSSHINIYRPTTSMVVLSWLFRKKHDYSYLNNNSSNIEKFELQTKKDSYF